MIVLGIDTSCDDSSVALVSDGQIIHSNIIASQHGFHEKYGGIVPTVASRRHCMVINPLIEMALTEAKISLDQVDAVAVSSDQGLAPSLAVGVSAAKALAMAIKRPLVGIHHVEGHIYSNVMAHPEMLRYPFLCATVAGGHTLLILAHAFGDYELLGTCRDDSAGEAYDKVARRLGLGYPGGPIIDELAKNGDPEAFAFPRPLIDSESLEFSFSGLKTSVNRTIEQFESRDDTIPINDLAASFQKAVIDVIVAKTMKAVAQTGVENVAIAGGVAANSLLKDCLTIEAQRAEIQLFIPPLELCIDNGAMVAGVGFHYLQQGVSSELDLDYRANAPLGIRALKYRALGKYRDKTPSQFLPI